MSPSRLIPGAQASIDAVPRKKASSVALNDELRTWQHPPSFLPPQRRDLFQILPEVVLPQPAVRGQRGRLAGQVLTDFLSILLSFDAVSHLGELVDFVAHRDLAAPLHPLSFPTPQMGLLLLYGALFTLLGYSERLYHPDIVQAPRQLQLVLGKVVIWSMLLVGTVISWSGLHVISVATLAASTPLSFLIMLGWRDLGRRLAARRTQSGRDVHNVLIIGAGKLGRELAAQLAQDRVRKRTVRGFLDENEPIGGDVRGRMADLAYVARTEFIDEIIVTPSQPREVARRVIHEAYRNRIDIKIVPDCFGYAPDAVMLEKFGSVPVLTLREERLPAFGLFLKRAVDILGSASALALATPLLAAIALAIKLDPPGPVLYQAARVGRKGRRFTCYKFRTMVADADREKERLRACNERNGPTFKIAHDPRITRVGRFLRRFSMDELPQLWNVLRGEMSLVGPRPHPLDDFAQYGIEDLQRLEVTPGLTGLWQVTARRDPSFEINMSLDLEYIQRWTLWTDFWILYKTVSVVLRGSGV